MKKCKFCKSILTKGPLQTKSAESEKFKVSIENIPTQICVKGCEGFYWPHVDFGVEVFDLLMEKSENYAKKKGFLKIRQLCKICDIELTSTEKKNTFKFSKQQADGNMINLFVSACPLICKQCNRNFLRAQISTYDKYYQDLSDVISEALTKELIWE